MFLCLRRIFAPAFFKSVSLASLGPKRPVDAIADKPELLGNRRRLSNKTDYATQRPSISRLILNANPQRSC